MQLKKNICIKKKKHMFFFAKKGLQKEKKNTQSVFLILI